MAIYKFNPENPRVMFSNPNARHTMVRAGGEVECSQEQADVINALSSCAGIDGAPALSLLNPPDPEPAPIALAPEPAPVPIEVRKPKRKRAPRKRKPKAED